MAVAPLRTIAMLGNSVPRQCGIATFTTDLTTALATAAPSADCLILAMNAPGAHLSYPPRVRFEIAQTELRAYQRAADFLNVNAVDVVSVQHEFGIFGGKAGRHVLALLRALRMPIVTTLHTVLSAPSPPQRAVLDEIVRLSERLVVMSEQGAMLLRDVHGVAARQIDLIPHGIPSVPGAAPSKDQLGLEGRSVILTFGLLSPDKGIEYVLEALPTILARHPNAVYVVLGATHPHVRERHGETYRLELEQRAQRLDVAANVVFHDRFVSERELTEFLAAADLCVMPYLNPERITSGTLAYAVGAGKAVISTPYRYATELLDDGRGVLVPFADASSIAQEVVALLDDDDRRRSMGTRAAARAASMLWPAVATRYLETFERARRDHADRRRSVFQAKTLATRPVELPDVNLEHVQLMTDQTGILQHAVFSVPRYGQGYCLDDNARALLLMTLLEDSGTEAGATVHALAARYLAFVFDAFVEGEGRFRNFMGYDRRWSERCGSEDSHGRALWALGTVVGHTAQPGRANLGGNLFHAALPAIEGFSSPRSWAYALLGIGEYLRAFEGDRRVETVRATLAFRLEDLLRTQATPDWPWFEDRVTYANARLPQALLVSGAAMGHPDMIAAAIRALEWLLKIQCSADGYFAPIGSNGFYVRGGTKAIFDQQPIDVCGMVSACLDARRVTGEHRWTAHAERAFGWFLGQNQIQRPLYDPQTGGCRDGLHADRTNENQGAESTLSFLMALEDMLAADRVTTIPACAAVAG